MNFTEHHARQQEVIARETERRPMSAKDLIAVAQAKGVSIGRRGRDRYYWTRIEGGEVVSHDFHGTWPMFVTFLKSL